MTFMGIFLSKLGGKMSNSPHAMLSERSMSLFSYIPCVRNSFSKRSMKFSYKKSSSLSASSPTTAFMA